MQIFLGGKQGPQHDTSLVILPCPWLVNNYDANLTDFRPSTCRDCIDFFYTGHHDWATSACAAADDIVPLLNILTGQASTYLN